MIKKQKRRDKMVFPSIKQQVLCAFSFRKYWNTFLFMLLFDALFLGCLYAAAVIFDSIFSRYEAALIGTYAGYGLLFVYFAAVCFAYSFFTYVNLSFLNTIRHVQSAFEFSKKKVLQFFGYNFVMGLAFFIVFFFLWTFLSVALVAVLKQTIVPIFLVLYMIFSFLFLQLSHVLFVAKKEIRFTALVKNTLCLFSWKWIGQWVFWNLCGGILVFLCYIALFGLLSSIGQRVADTATLLQFYMINILIFLFLIFVTYCFVFLNRLYLFIIIRQEIEKKKI